MVSTLTRKAIISIKKNLDMYGSAMTKLQEKIAAIDEKYRKMAEEARKDLAAELANLEAEQEIWQTSLSRYDVDDVNEVLGEVDAAETTDDTQDDDNDNTAGTDVSEAETEAEPEKEVVTDTIFPENNDDKSDSDEKKDTVEEPAVEEPAPVEETLSKEEQDINKLWPGFEEQPATPAEAVEELPVEEVPVEEVPAPESEEPVDLGLGDNYPEFPQEW